MGGKTHGQRPVAPRDERMHVRRPSSADGPPVPLAAEHYLRQGAAYAALRERHLFSRIELVVVADVLATRTGLDAEYELLP